MILGQVRKDRHVIFASVRAILRQGMRRHFHHCSCAAAGDHRGEQLLQLKRTRGRVCCRHRALTDLIDNGSNQSYWVAQGFQQSFADIRRGGFSVRPSHADHPNVRRGVSIKSAAQQTERLSGVVNADEWKRHLAHRLL